MKNFPVKHGQCNSIIFPETFSFGSSKYLSDIPIGDSRILLKGPGIYPQICHRTQYPEVLFCKRVGMFINSKGGVRLFGISQKERFSLSHLL